MAIVLRTIKSQLELLDISANVIDLFSICFPGRKLEYNVWKWAYILNPFGEPCVSVAYDENRMIGHYATIPINLVNAHGDKLISHLSMTTMIHKRYTKYGLFQKLADLTYDSIKSLGVDLVYGFPNKSSKPGFTKRLSWNISEMRLMHFMSKSDFVKTNQYRSFYSEFNSHTIDLTCPSSLAWRLSKPGIEYIYTSGAYFKPHANHFDLIYIKNRKDFESSSINIGFNAICTADECTGNYVDYDCGFRSFRSLPGFTLFSQLACSDIF